MQEIAALTPTFSGVTYEKIERLGSVQWPCTDEDHSGTPTMHEETFTRGPRSVHRDRVCANGRALHAAIPAHYDDRPYTESVQRGRTNAPYGEFSLA